MVKKKGPGFLSRFGTAVQKVAGAAGGYAARHGGKAARFVAKETKLALKARARKTLRGAIVGEKARKLRKVYRGGRTYIIVQQGGSGSAPQPAPRLTEQEISRRVFG